MPIGMVTDPLAEPGAGIQVASMDEIDAYETCSR